MIQCSNYNRLQLLESRTILPSALHVIYQLLIRYLNITGSSDSSKETVNSNPQTILFHFKGRAVYVIISTQIAKQNGGQQKGLKTVEILLII